MQIKRSSKVEGLYFELIPGQSRYSFGHSDFEEFFEIPDWLKSGGYQGSTIHFMDMRNGNVFIPFEKQRNVLYGNPIFCDGAIYFLQGDFNRSLITLYRYLPDTFCECVCQLDMQSLNLYNLRLTGTPVHIISHDEKLISYYPVKFECPVNPNESLMHIENERLYFSAWVEEGIENERITEHYRYYEKLIIKDFHGNVLSEEVGNLNQFPDGSWWLS